MKPGLSPEGEHKRLKLSNDSLTPDMTHDEIEPKTPKDNVVDYSNPFAISEVLDHLDGGKYGRVTKDTEALMAQKVQVKDPFYAKYPRLLYRFSKVVTNCDEKAPKLENQQVTGLAYKDVINLEEEQSKKVAPAATAPSTIVSIDSDEEDDRDKKSFIPFHQVVLSRTVAPSPAIGMIVSFSLFSFFLKKNFKYVNIEIILIWTILVVCLI
jgi:DNA repair and recombination RAD54-like protein